MSDGFSVGNDSNHRANEFAGLSAEFLAISLHNRNQSFDADFVARENAEIDFVSKRVLGETPAGDVVSDVKALKRQYALASVYDLPLPTATIPEVGNVPVINPEFKEEFFPSAWKEQNRESVKNWWFQSCRRNFGTRWNDFHGPFHRDFGLQGFRKGLALFLGYRIEGFRFWSARPTKSMIADLGPPRPGTALSGNTGFQIELSCQHSHLAAYASPAYALTWRNLGSFTNPARGVLPPGVWIFGAEGDPLQHFEYDPSVVHLPPNFTPSTTRF